MVMTGRSVHLTTLFPGQAWTSSYPELRSHTFSCNWQQPFLNDSGEGRRMTVETISWSISTKVWDRAGIELATPGSAVRLASVARHVTDCAMWPGHQWLAALSGQLTYILLNQFGQDHAASVVYNKKKNIASMSSSPASISNRSLSMEVLASYTTVVINTNMCWKWLPSNHRSTWCKNAMSIRRLHSLKWVWMCSDKDCHLCSQFSSYLKLVIPKAKYCLHARFR